MTNLYKKKSRWVVFAILTFGLIIGQWACRKPTEGVQATMNISAATGTTKYHILVQVRDAAILTQTPAGAAVAVTGQDAAYVINSSGSKSLAMQNGLIEIAIDPNRNPESNLPVSFDLAISAAGYLPQVRQIQVAPSQFNQKVFVDLVNIKNPPAGMRVTEANISLTNGAVTALTKINLEKGTVATLATSAVNGPLSIAKLKANAAADDPKPEAVAVPFTVQDGFVTLVFPKGATFYYKVLDTGTVKHIESVAKYDTVWHKIATSNINGKVEDIPVPRFVGYYDKEVAGPRYKKIAYTGAVKIVCKFLNYNSSENLKVFPVNADGVDYGKTISLLKNKSGRENRLLFDGITTQTGYPETVNYTSEIKFLGTDAKNVPFSISPDSVFKWFVSYKLDGNKINPLTTKKIAAGDSVETGIDIEHNRTYRTVVKAVPVGTEIHLRTESQSANAGFYYEAPYTQTYDLTFSGSVPKEITEIPDKENIAFTSDVQMGEYNLSLPYYIGMPATAMHFTGNIVSSSPITSPRMYFDVSYWWKSLVSKNQTTGFTAQVDFFAGTSIRLEPRVDFEMCIKCTEKSLLVTPNQWAYVIFAGDDSPYRRTQRNIHLVNGKWSTMGLSLGGKYTATGTFLGKNPKYNLLINTQLVRDTAYIDCGAIRL